MKPETLTELTVDDVVRGGACVDGVNAFRDMHFPRATVVSVKAALHAAGKDDRGYIEVAAGLSGHGDGGYGGYGHGDGYGDGYGHGHGDGHGDGGYGGYGHGDGYGDGYGDGDG